MFQSTHPRRVRLGDVIVDRVHDVFQSTHPRRVRLQVAHTDNISISFNPRTHVGCDIFANILCTCKLSFNPRTHVGCDKWRLMFAKHVIGFNPRTHVGCDLQFQICCSQATTFQSTHPRRVRPNTNLKKNAYAQVSIHAPT